MSNNPAMPVDTASSEETQSHDAGSYKDNNLGTFEISFFGDRLPAIWIKSKEPKNNKAQYNNMVRLFELIKSGDLTPEMVSLGLEFSRISDFSEDSKPAEKDWVAMAKAKAESQK